MSISRKSYTNVMFGICDVKLASPSCGCILGPEISGDTLLGALVSLLLLLLRDGSFGSDLLGSSFTGVFASNLFPLASSSSFTYRCLFCCLVDCIITVRETNQKKQGFGNLNRISLVVCQWLVQAARACDYMRWGNHATVFQLVVLKPTLGLHS